MTRIVNDNVADARHQLAQRHEEMLARQALSELVLANITDTITLFDRNWRYIYVNDAATRAIGLSREQILEQTLWELWCRGRERFASGAIEFLEKSLDEKALFAAINRSLLLPPSSAVRPIL